MQKFKLASSEIITVENSAKAVGNSLVTVDLPHGGARWNIRLFLTESAFSGFRVVFRGKLDGESQMRIHHQALSRMHLQHSVPITTEFGDKKLFHTSFTTPGNFELSCGHQDMMLHNAILCFRPGGGGWLCAPLKESAAKLGYSWRELPSGEWEITVIGAFQGLAQRSVSDGIWELEPLFIQEFEHIRALSPELFTAYHQAILNDRGEGRMTRGPLARHELFWGSWNEGIYRNISHKMLITEAKFLAENFPNVRWFQIDDGYHAGAEGSAAGIGCSDIGAHYSDETAWCRKRFPQGMRALSDAIRDFGLRPMIWFSPSCTVNRRLFKEHPNWFRPYERLHFVKEFAFPDYSLPPVRDLMKRALDRLFIDWKFEGVKLDFWSYAFFRNGSFFRIQSATALEWVEWLETEIRQRIGESGLMLSCLEPANGDPFRSNTWDMHRVGPDITGKTSRKTFEEIAIWVAALHGLKQTNRWFWMADGDGLSLYRHGIGANDAHWRLITTFLVASGSAVELGGLLSRQTQDTRFPAFRRAVSAIRHGQEIICPGYEWTDNQKRAPFVWLRRDHDGGGILGLTNWDDTEKELPIPEELRGVKALDIFNGDMVQLPAVRKLPPGDAELWRLGSL